MKKKLFALALAAAMALSLAACGNGNSASGGSASASGSTGSDDRTYVVGICQLGLPTPRWMPPPRALRTP